MLKSLRCVVVLGALGIAAFACTAGSTTGGLGGGAEPVKQAEVTSPTSGAKVTATISSVTLGEECANTPAAGSGASATCAAPPASKADAGGDGGASGIAPGPGGCGGFCQGSNVQIAFTSTAGSKAVSIEIVKVTLHEASTGKLVDTLKASKPQSWNGSTYAAWDEKVQPSTELKASYDLTSPAWSTINSDSARTTSAYSTAYTLDVTLRIDGVEVTLESAGVNREPPVAT